MLASEKRNRQSIMGRRQREGKESRVVAVGGEGAGTDGELLAG